jgi:membrane-associated phospholipid phosphatase
MGLWPTASAVFFVYVVAVAAVLPRVPRRRRARALGLASLGLAAAIAASRTDLHSVLDDLILPPALLLLGYRATGDLFIEPMPHAERALIAFDRALDVGRTAAALPRGAAELLEFAYAGVYPIIPIALAIHLIFADQPDPDRFWAVILVTDFICFGMLPWVQTRPPRALEPAAPWHSSFRRFNLRLLGTASIHVNTFPSGHAAEALAAALLSLGAPWPIAAWMFVNAAAISAGAVLGRYHYAADALAGWAVALAVWVVLGGVRF